jgi:uncharacterized protein
MGADDGQLDKYCPLKTVITFKSSIFGRYHKRYLRGARQYRKQDGDPSGWQPLVEAHPDWFEVIHLYGTESGWDRLKKLVEAHEDADARHQILVDLIAPAARNIHAYWLAPAGDTIGDTRRPIHKMPVPGRNDPCPCGSGKKFKYCHGAPKSLH